MHVMHILVSFVSMVVAEVISQLHMLYFALWSDCNLPSNFDSITLAFGKLLSSVCLGYQAVL